MRNERTRATVRALALGTVVTLALASCSHEAADWKSATLANTSEAYQSFLQQYPHSRETTEAQSRVKQLTEERDWQNAIAANTRDSYQDFMAQHPDSKWGQEAKIRIENFAQADSGSAALAKTPATAPAAAPNAMPTATPEVAGAGVATAGKDGAAGKHGAHTVAQVQPRSNEQWVQLGAFASKARAESHWKLLTEQYATLKPLQPHYVTVKSHQRHIYRLQVRVSSSAANGLCATLKRHSQVCMRVNA